MIFFRAAAPYFLLDTSMAGGQNSAFCQSIRIKKAIIGVCKSWWQIGLKILYEDFVFHYIGQISPLAYTLEAHSGLRKLVKKLTVRCFVPSECIRLFEEQLRRVVGYCPFITGTIYSPLHLSWWDEFSLPGI